MEHNCEMAHFWFDGDCSVSMPMRKLLLASFGTVEQTFEQSDEAIRRCLDVHFDMQTIDRLLNRRTGSYLEEELLKLRERNITVLYPEHPLYPEKLKHIYDMPRMLFARGKIRESLNYYNQTIAIVGARDADTYSREATRVFARELAKKGIQIASGLAKGIDSQAHIGCMEAGGYTIAVLGCGINVTYPRANVELYTEIERKGLILSEYGLDVPPNNFQFPLRNRIISGISDGVLVACAKKKSGSLITADHALEQGKQVYAFPGRPLDTFSEGTNHLIQLGAMCVTRPKDILCDLWGEEKLFAGETSERTDAVPYSEDRFVLPDEAIVSEKLTPDEKRLYRLIRLDPVHVDALIEQSRLGVRNTISILYELERNGFIKQSAPGYYILNL